MSRVISQALDYTAWFNADTKRLHGLSPVYPDIYQEMHKNGEFVASTLVHWQYEGVTYSRHHVERGFMTKPDIPTMVLRRLKEACEKCKTMAVPCQYDEIVTPKIKTNDQ
jgi:hypothetical protein